MKQQCNEEFIIKAGPAELKLRNVSGRIIFLIALAFLVLAFAIGYSFIRGWSTIKADTQQLNKLKQEVQDEYTGAGRIPGKATGGIK